MTPAERRRAADLNSWRELRPAFLLLVLSALCFWAALARAEAATLVWGCTPPTETTDGKPITQPLRYRAYWGTTPTTVLHNITPYNCTTPTSIEVPGPAGVTHYLTTSAAIGDGTESDYSSWRLRLASTALPVKVDCAVSAYGEWTASAWTPTVCASVGIQTRQETRARQIVTQPSGGGVACPALAENRTVTQPCVLPVLRTVDIVGYQLNLGSRNKITLSRVASVPIGKECIQAMSVTDPFRTVYIIKDRLWAVMDPNPKKPGQFYTRPNQVWARCEAT